MDRRLFIVSALAVSAAASGAWAQSGFRSDRISARVRGRGGRDVVFIPGLASTSDVWTRTAERIDDRCRVHLIDIRGFGGLEPGANAEGPVSGAVSREIGRYIREAGLARPALVGHSLGGQMAIRTAADQGSGVERLMVVDSAPFFPALIHAAATVGDVEPIARIAYQAVLFLGEEALREQAGGMGVRLGGAADAVFQTLGWQGGHRRLIAQALYEVLTTDLRHRLPEVAAETTVVYGSTRDADAPRRDFGRMLRPTFASLPEPARFVPIEGAEHMVMIDRPSAFNAAVDRFLA